MATTKQIIKTNKLTEERMAKIKDYLSLNQVKEQADQNKTNIAKDQTTKEESEQDAQKNNKVDKKKAKPILCEPCRLKIKKEQEATGFCEDCFEYLCSGCVETHKKGRILRTHAHNILQGKEMPRFTGSEEDAYEMCRCKLGVVRYFCKDHNIVICKTCKLYTHRSCRFADITNMSKDFSISREFRNEMKDLRTIRINCEKFRKSCLKDVSNVSKTCSEILLEINKTRQKITNVIDKFEEDVRKELNHVIAKEEAHIKESQVKCEALKETIEKRLASVERLKEQNNEAALFLAFHRKQGETEKLQKTFDAIEEMSTEVKITFVKRDLTSLLSNLEKLGEIHLERISKNADNATKPIWATGRHYGSHVHVTESIDTDRSKAKSGRYTHRPNTKMEISSTPLTETESGRKRDVKSVPADRIGERQDNTYASKSTYLRNIRRVAAETKYSIVKKAEQNGEATDVIKEQDTDADVDLDSI